MTLLAHWITRQAALRAAAPALTLDGGELSYGELRDLGRRLGAGLAARGVRAGQVVAVAADDSTELALAALGASFAGAAFFPLDVRLPQARRDRLQDAAGVEHRLVGAELLGVPMKLAARPPHPRPSPARGEGKFELTPSPEGVELLIATGGSGGEPRVAVLTARNLEESAAAAAAWLPLAPGDCWVGCLPLFHVGGMALLYRCARAGARLRLHDGFAARRVLEDLTAHGASHVSLVPAMLAALLEQSGAAALPSSVKCLLVGGAPLSEPLSKRVLAAGWPVYITYGMTETASQVATGRLEADWSPGRVGQPLPGLAVDISHDGRIRVRGGTVMAGYAGDGRRPARGTEEGVFVSGDLGRLEADGSLVVLGRADAALVSGGENVDPEAVEALLAQCPGVEDAALGARPDPAWGDRLVALVVGSADPAAVERWCREHLPPPWRPRSILKVAALPRNAMHKLDRARLRRLIAELETGEMLP